MTGFDRQRGRAARDRAVQMAGVLVVVAGIGGCGGARSEPGPRPSSSTTAATPATGATTSPTSGPTVAAIKTAFVEFFDPATPLSESMALLQDGPTFKEALEKQARTSFAKATTVTVSAVSLDSPTKATVVFSILLSGTPVLENTKGHAVQQGGTWRVARSTLCGLLAAQGPAPRACRQAAATPTPH